MHSSLKLLLALAPVPLLLAPVRLQDASPPLLQNMGNSVAPESYSLPAADALLSPTVIPVSPTITLGQPSATLPPAVATPSAPFAQPAANPNLMPLMAAQLCQQALATTTQLALLSYEQKQNQQVAALTVAASAASARAASRLWPNAQAIDVSYKKLPWGTPYSKEIATTAKAAVNFCSNPANSAVRHGIGHSQVPIPRPN